MIFENADKIPVKFSLMYYLVAQLCSKRVQKKNPQEMVEGWAEPT